jgi:hypothetical protein
MTRESRTVDRSDQVESPTQRHLPLVDLLIDTRAELMELAVASGLKVLTTMLEADRTALCGPRYQHQAERAASRAGRVSGEVVLGGRKVQIRRPRVRADGHEVALPTFEAFADTDPLNRRVVEQMLIGVATRQYGRSLEPTGPEVHTRGRARAVSRRFVAKTATQLAAWRSTALDALDLVALLIDGVHIGEHCIVVALGIDHTGVKHALGLWDGSTENAAVCQSLLADLLHQKEVIAERALIDDCAVRAVYDAGTINVTLRTAHHVATSSKKLRPMACHDGTLRDRIRHGENPMARRAAARVVRRPEGIELLTVWTSGRLQCRLQQPLRSRQGDIGAVSGSRQHAVLNKRLQRQLADARVDIPQATGLLDRQCQPRQRGVFGADSGEESFGHIAPRSASHVRDIDSGRPNGSRSIARLFRDVYSLVERSGVTFVTLIRLS